MGLTKPEPISEEHNLSMFECGYLVLSEWLQKRALKNNKEGASKTYVVCANGGIVVGYYCLSTGAIANHGAPGNIRRNMPDPLPVMVLGRLAVDATHQSKGVGSGLLRDAMLRTLEVSRHVGVRALLVHAISEEAKAFYLRYQFQPSILDDMTLSLSVKHIQRNM